MIPKHLIGVVGSRRRKSYADRKQLELALDRVINSLPPDEPFWLVSGGCKDGADNFAEKIAYEKGYTILVFNAEWNRLGKGAGFVRNSDIARCITKLIAVVADDRTGGTEDTIVKVERLKKEVILVTSDYR